MNKRDFLLNLATTITIGGLATTAAHAQTTGYPNKPVKIIVAFPAGTGPDIVARIYADQLQKAFGQAFLIDNRPGAGSIIAAEAAASSPADGYTLFFSVKATMTIAPHVYPKAKFHPVKDFRPISQVLTLPHLITATPSAPFSNLTQLVDAAKKNPGKIDYASLGVGSQSHVAMEYWAHQLGIKLNHIPYKSNPSTDVMGGIVSLFLEGSGSAVQLIKSGRVKALAVSGSTRLPSLPDVPTVTEYKNGIDDDGIVGSTWHAFFAPKGTPDDVIMRLNSEIVKISRFPDVRQRLLDIGAIATGTSSAELATVMEKDYSLMGKIVRELQITAE